MSCVAPFLKPFKALHLCLVWKEGLISQQAHNSLPRCRRQWWDTTRKKEAGWFRLTSRPLTNCYQGGHPRIIPPAPPSNGSQLLSVSGGRCKKKNKNWLEPPRSKMAEDLTPSGPCASLSAHCHALAKWHAHLVLWQLTVAMTTTGEDQTRTEKESCISPASEPHPLFLDTSWIFPPLLPIPSLLLWPCFIYGVSARIGLRSWFANQLLRSLAIE